jgi:hypothetical protein
MLVMIYILQGRRTGVIGTLEFWYLEGSLDAKRSGTGVSLVRLEETWWSLFIHDPETETAEDDNLLFHLHLQPPDKQPWKASKKKVHHNAKNCPR